MGKVNYYETCKRHYHDGMLLLSNNCKPNAGQLFGISAECGIKGLLVGFGYPADEDGGLCHRDQFRKHINDLNRCFTQLSSEINGRSGGEYIAMITMVGNFQNWSADQRYHSAAAIPDSYNDWMLAAEEIVLMIERAKIDGVIR